MSDDVYLQAQSECLSVERWYLYVITIRQTRALWNLGRCIIYVHLKMLSGNLLPSLLLFQNPLNRHLTSPNNSVVVWGQKSINEVLS